MAQAVAVAEVHVAGRGSVRRGSDRLPTHLFADLFKRGERVGGDSFAAVEESVVVEPVLNRRAVAQAASKATLHGLAQNVRAGVPEDL